MTSAATNWRRVGCAFAISALAHALVAASGRIELPETAPEPMPLAVRMVEAPVRAAVHPPAPVNRHAQKARRRAAAAPAAAPATAPSPAVTAATQTEGVGMDPAPESDAVADAPAATPDAVALADAAAPEAPAPATTSEPATPPRTLPRKGRITYDLVYGRDRFPVGRTVQTWEADGDRYQLASRSETVGIVDLIRSQQRVYSSRGAVTATGLRPESFTSGRDRGRGRGLEEASARFDWTRSLVLLGKPAALRQEKLPPGSQDLLSFVFQLSLDPPPPGRFTQVVTNGSRIDTYELEVLKEESIDTPMGVLKTLPIRQLPKNNQESIEVWLATEYRYLPVRLRFFDRQGEPQGEQIVADIRVVEN